MKKQSSIPLAFIALCTTLISANSVQAKASDLSQTTMTNASSSRVLSSVDIEVTLPGTLEDPLAVYLTPVGGGQTLSFLCFSSTVLSVPPGSYDVKFTIPTSNNPLHQIDVSGYGTLWVNPFPSEPYISGGIITNLNISSGLTFSAS